MPDRLPVDTVIFDPSTLVDAPGAGAAARPRRGVRRLVAALAAQGVHTAVGEGPSGVAGALAAAGVHGLVDAATIAAPGRTLTVTAAPPGASAPGDAKAGGAVGAPAAPTVAVRDGEAVHEAVLRWLGQQVGGFAAAAALTAPPDPAAVRGAEERHLRLTKPPGSLGRLEAIGCQLAGIAAEVPPPVPRPAAVAVFAGDHGVHAQGVSPWPQEVTAQMVANFVAGGAAINVLARQVGARVTVVDVGVATALDPQVAASEQLLDRRIRPGTADLSTGPAMTRDEARQALDVGVDVAARLVAEGARCLVTGDMGIANTTPSAALIAALGDRPAQAVTGRGTGVDDATLGRKAALVEAAAARATARHGGDALGALAEVGGLEHAALAGFIVGGAALQVPVVVDGVIAAAALLVAARLAPEVVGCVIAGHRSVEPGAAAVLGALRLDPLVDLGLRLGEGTGAALALPLVEAAARVLDEMATFDQAGVSDKGA
jgi:nicotinate-nucleotide--dimethylbenzimidazole phosphoribosyltransferase